MIPGGDATLFAESIINGAEQRMIADMTDRLTDLVLKDGSLTIVEAEELAHLPSLARKATTDVLLEYQPKIKREVQSVVINALEASDKNDIEIISRKAQLSPIVGVTKSFQSQHQRTAAGLAAIVERQNIAMAQHMERLWYEVVAEAISDYNHGQPMRDVMERAVSKLGDQRLQTIDYASGISTRIDAAVRRHVVTQLNQTATRLTEQRCEEFGHDLVATTAHFGARPTHAPWQGKVFSRTGSSERYPNLVESTGYGTVTGLCGANCNHTFYPYAEGLTQLQTQPEFDEYGRTNDEVYDLTQKQRRRELNIRRTKEKIALGQSRGLEMTQERLKLGRLQANQRAFVKENHLVRFYERERAYAINAPQPRALRVG